VAGNPINAVDPYGLEGSIWEYISSWGSAAAGGVEGGSRVVELGKSYGDFGIKPIAESGILPNPLEKWGGAAKKFGTTLTVAATGVEVVDICRVGGDSLGKKAAKSSFAIGANAVGYLAGAGAVAVVGTFSLPLWGTVALGTLAVGGIGWGVSASKKSYNNYIERYQ